VLQKHRKNRKTTCVVEIGNPGFHFFGGLILLLRDARTELSAEDFVPAAGQIPFPADFLGFAGRTGVFENIWRDRTDDLQHLLGEGTDLPLRAGAEPVLEEVEQTASIHRDDDICFRPLRREVTCVFWLDSEFDEFFDRGVELSFEFLDLFLRSGVSLDRRRDDEVCVSFVVPAGFDRVGRDAVTDELRLGDATDSGNGECECDVLDGREVSGADDDVDQAFAFFFGKIFFQLTASLWRVALIDRGGGGSLRIWRVSD